VLSGNTTTHCYTTAGLLQHNYRHKMKHLNALVLSDLTQDYGDMLPQHTHTYTHTHTHLTAVFPGLPRWASTRKIKSIWIFLKQETVSGSGISWAICKSAPCSRQITTPAPHHSVFYRPDALPAAQPTASKHWSLPQRRHYVPIPNQLSKLTKLSIPSASKNH